MGAIANLFGYLLNFLYNIFNNYGIAIIVFSVILRIILIPVTISQQKSIKKNEKMQEKMKEYQNALDDMSNEAVEYVRGIPVVKTFGQTIFSFKKFKDSIYTTNYNYTFCVLACK